MTPVHVTPVMYFSLPQVEWKMYPPGNVLCVPAFDGKPRHCHGKLIGNDGHKITRLDIYWIY